MAESNKKYNSLEDLAKHNKPGDLWISIQGKIYNVSDWAKSHLDGELPLLNLTGQDVTNTFVAYHPSSAWQHLDQFFNGPVLQWTSSPLSSLPRLIEDGVAEELGSLAWRRTAEREAQAALVCREKARSRFGCQECTAAELNSGGCGGCELWALQVRETKSIWGLGDPRWWCELELKVNL